MGKIAVFVTSAGFCTKIDAIKVLEYIFVYPCFKFELATYQQIE